MQFDDRMTNIVYLAEHLKDRYPQVFYPAKTNLEANGIKIETIPNTRNIWLRDWMPVQVGDHFVKFQYDKETEYLQLAVSEMDWNGICPTIISDLILDGGNIVRNHEKVIITEKVFQDNWETYKKNGVVKELERLLESQIIIIPVEPGDTLGHSDGICKFVDDKTILINDYSLVFSKDNRLISYDKKIRQIFENSGLDVETLPYAYGEWDWDMAEEEFRKQYPEADEFNPGFGYYINFLIVMGLILVPVMGIEMDVKVMRTLRRLYPHFNIVAIDCGKLSMEGGLLGCVTANYINF